jgi:hypothetical protein
MSKTRLFKRACPELSFRERGETVDLVMLGLSSHEKPILHEELEVSMTRIEVFVMMGGFALV